MDLDLIQAQLRSGRPPEEAQLAYLREVLAVVPSLQADRAMDLFAAYPAQCKVSLEDKALIEAVADRSESTYISALALGLLCNWLS
ncbi:MAG TPA: hypothetical protein VG742_13040, partial [Dongiaceae bacterium]|nr:hypothetical protein [Dongiaceae bacterium]